MCSLTELLLLWNCALVAGFSAFIAIHESCFKEGYRRNHTVKLHNKNQWQNQLLKRLSQRSDESIENEQSSLLANPISDTSRLSLAVERRDDQLQNSLIQNRQSHTQLKIVLCTPTTVSKERNNG
jgi:hypothetical protein